MSNSLLDQQSLSDFGNVVQAGYVYRDKEVCPREEFVHPACRLKWYDIWPEALPITESQRAEAKAFLTDEIDGRRLLLDRELGFVCLHRCDRVLLLLVVTWRSINEMYESAYTKEVASDSPYRLIDFPTSHRATYCVWEMLPVWHERNAWTRYLKSARDEAAKQAYLGDCMDGSR
jgi:hypothetical protein